MNLAFDLNSNQETQALTLKTPSMNEKEKRLHADALTKAANFKKAHAELLSIVMEVDQLRLFEKFMLTSTFSYCTQILNLSEDVTCTLTKLARASQKVPELKSAIDEGLNISKAREIASIVTKENKTEWIEKAKTLPQKTLQREVAAAFPQTAVFEKTKYVTAQRIKLELGLDEETMALFRQAQDLVSQRSRSPAKLEDTLKAVLEYYIDKHDPMKRAERSQKKGVTNLSPAARRVAGRCKLAAGEGASQSPIMGRSPIPAAVVHQINLRDQRKCQARMPNGALCANTRWLEYHHKIPVQYGGTNTIENLITLCSHHHRQHHK